MRVASRPCRMREADRRLALPIFSGCNLPLEAITILDARNPDSVIMVRKGERSKTG